MSGFIKVLGALVLVTTVLGCSKSQRDGALVAVRDMQSSGVAYASQEGESAAVEEHAPQQGLPPGGAPPGAPGAPPAAPPPPPGAAAAPPAPAGAPGEPAQAEAKTNEQIIDEFMQADPREILEEKTKDLKDRQTQPWMEEKPETFIPETGRSDPMTLVLDAVPDELRPKRGDEDESDIETYLVTMAATQALQAVTSSLRCHSVIQIGIQKYAQLSFRGQPGRFPVSEGNGFNQNVQGIMISITVVSISTDEVVVNVSVNPGGTNVVLDKDMVFIPRY